MRTPQPRRQKKSGGNNLGRVKGAASLLQQAVKQSRVYKS